MKVLTTIAGFSLLIMALLFEFGCNSESRGFALPQGDIEKGKLAFVYLHCDQCHSAGEMKRVGHAIEGDINITLGGDVTKLKTYGELVTSVINPSHKIGRKYKEAKSTETGESKMRKYNEIMSVDDLVNLVTFLQDEYNLVPPATTYYVY